MKITLSGGTAIEEEGGMLTFEGNCVVLRKASGKAQPPGKLIFAYCLGPREQVRKFGDNEYEVIF